MLRKALTVIPIVAALGLAACASTFVPDDADPANVPPSSSQAAT